VLCARPAVGDQPFFVHLADDLIEAETPCLAQMAQAYSDHHASVLGVETVPMSETDKYGIVATEERKGRISRVKQIVEKPRPSSAPSNLAVVGRYLLTPRIFDKLEKTGRGAGGEIQLTDAIADLLGDETVLAYEFEGKRYDCGSKLGYLKATVEYALRHDSLGTQFSEYLKQMSKELK
jgi:UTP--glucose-1-phosphate uridylyltransferase